MTAYRRLATPIGELVLSGDGALEGVWFDPHRGVSPVVSSWQRDDDAFDDAVVQLSEWFAGTRTSFSVELRPAGTPFQHAVWDALVEIPYGETVTYTELAAGTGGGPRAVGSANAANPMSIIVPCHRVIGADGHLTGYAGGVERKQWLLAHEKHVVTAMAGKVGDPSLQP